MWGATNNLDCNHDFDSIQLEDDSVDVARAASAQVNATKQNADLAKEKARVTAERDARSNYESHQRRTEQHVTTAIRTIVSRSAPVPGVHTLSWSQF
jgi:hypothetical protein